MTITSALESDLPFKDEVVSIFNNEDVSMGKAHITEDDFPIRIRFPALADGIMFRLTASQLSGEAKFSGAAPAANGKIIFSPMEADGVGVFDPADDSFYLVDISARLSGEVKFYGAAEAANGKITFSPMFADGVGIFDPADNSF